VQKSELPEASVGPRLQAILLLGVIAALALVPPSLVERLPSLCINRHLFGWCPGCGSLRALVYLFHGSVGQALKFNPNCLITGPVLVILLLASLRRAAFLRRAVKPASGPAMRLSPQSSEQ
jgi:hypothetical protein